LSLKTSLHWLDQIRQIGGGSYPPITSESSSAKVRATGHASSRHLLARTKRKRRVEITPATVATSACRTLSVILPAFNEARALPATLAALDVARRRVELRFGCETEVLVVDNASTDATAGVARDAGARVVSEPSRNLARARNAGASAARGDVLVFVDADTWGPPEALEQIAVR
jgi:cellulose synthase/poly-beta-1,6-N-acetylglucosamine synthase-like glycosyltransferase